MYFFAKDELISIVPNFSLQTENGTAQCIGVRGGGGVSLGQVRRQKREGSRQPSPFLNASVLTG